MDSANNYFLVTLIKNKHARILEIKTLIDSHETVVDCSNAWDLGSPFLG